jgi:hypothetical protein
MALRLGDGSAGRRRFESRLNGLWLSVLRRLSHRRENAAPSVYLAYSIAEMLAIGVHELDVQNDEGALKKATPLFRDGLERIEVWCGSRKVGEIPPRSDEISGEEAVRDSA